MDTQRDWVSAGVVPGLSFFFRFPRREAADVDEVGKTAYKDEASSPWLHYGQNYTRSPAAQFCDISQNENEIGRHAEQMRTGQ